MALRLCRASQPSLFPRAEFEKLLEKTKFLYKKYPFLKLLRPQSWMTERMKKIDNDTNIKFQNVKELFAKINTLEKDLAVMKDKLERKGG